MPKYPKQVLEPLKLIVENLHEDDVQMLTVPTASPGSPPGPGSDAPRSLAFTRELYIERCAHPHDSALCQTIA